MATQKFVGIGVAVTTPFKSDYSVDHAALKKHIHFLKENNIDFLVILGTTGESVTLSENEKNAVVDTVKEANKGELPFVLGIGGSNTSAVLRKMEDTDFSGIDGILSVVPSYNKPSQRGLYEHFKAISKHSPVPIILYNVPGRTGKNIEPETIIQLAKDCDNIIAVKEASGSLSQSMHIIQDKPDDFTVLSGEDDITLPLMSIGIEGVISVIGNAFPMQWSKMVHYALKNDFLSAQPIHYQLITMIEKIFAEGNPAGIKCVLSHMGIIENHLRLPLVPVSKTLEKELKQLISQVKQK
jgi:4-hydroxy-tetrahydrodipicolinate synthase